MKQVHLGLVILCIILCLVGCSTSATIETATSTSEAMTPETAEAITTTATAIMTTATIAATVNTATTIATVSTVATTTVPPEPSPRPIGETIVIEDIAEITVESLDYQDELTIGDYTILEEKNDSDIFLLITVQYKNLSTSTIDSSTLGDVPGIRFGKAVYDGKYEYSANNVWRLIDIAPLSTGTIACSYTFPKEVATSDAPLTVSITIGNEEFILDLH